ncbi:MAG: SOS response-associated peptidase family protein [Caulobacteraceae bacterium]|nr:SOS response-associated peptidase family protein [Caulobacteraceae bacterium]
MRRPVARLASFAGIWREWTGDYGSEEEPNAGAHLLFSFLTTDANELVRPVHAKAMPVVLRSDVEREEWLNAPADQVEEIQTRVLPTEALEIVTDAEAAQYVGGYASDQRASRRDARISAFGRLMTVKRLRASAALRL